MPHQATELQRALAVLATHGNDFAAILELVRRVSCDELPTDVQAAEEMELVKRIIDRHANSAWLIGYNHSLDGEGFQYDCAYGRYENLAEV
jgi:hypothetical protein